MKASGVAHFFSRMDRAGAELRTIDVVQRIGQRFDFYALSGDQGSLDDFLESQGHRVHHVRLSPSGVIRLWYEMRAQKYRVVHCHLGIASGFVLMAAALARVPIRIAHFRSDAVGGERRLLKRLYLTISRILIDVFANHIVGVSPASIAGWRADWQDDDRCSVISNGFDVGALREAAGSGEAVRLKEQDRMVVSNIGRVDLAKNRGRAIQIWQQLAATHYSTLYLVGELNASDMASVSAWNARGEEGSSIVEVGDTSSVPGYLGRSDVLLVTSTREGLPGVVLEALAIGTPVVSSSLPGVEWIASMLPGITMCSLQDADSKWVSAIETAARCDRERIRRGFDSGPFTLERVLPAFKSLWCINDPYRTER